MSAEVGTAFVSVLPDFKGFSASLRRQLKGQLSGVDGPAAAAGTRAGTSFGHALQNAVGSSLARIGTMLKTGLIAGAAAGAAALGGIALFGLKSAAALEQTQIGFQSLLGSAVEAKRVLGDLQKFAAETPFEFQGIADAGRRVLAFADAVGLANDQLIPTLTTIGDLVSLTGGTQESFDSVVRALGQIASKGKVSQEELLQIAEALPGFQVNAGLAAQLGLSVADSMKAITAGAVPAAAGVQALLRAMAAAPGAAGAMEAQSKTLLGVFSTFKDTVGQRLTEAFQPVIPLIKDSLTQLTPVIGTALQTLAPALGGFIAGLLPLLGDLVTGLTPVLTPILKFLTELSGGAQGVIGPLGEAFGKVLDALVPLAPVLGDVGAQLLLALIPALEKLAPELPPLVLALTDLLIALTPLIPLFTDLLASTDYTVLHGLVAAINGVTAAIQWLTSYDWAGLWNSITTGVSDAIGTVVGFFQRLPGQVGGFLAGLPGLLAQSAQRAFNAFLFAVGFGIGAAIRFFYDLPGRVIEAVTLLWTQVKALFTTGVENTQSTLTSGIARLIGIARELPGRFIEAMRTLPERLRDFAVGVVARATQLGRDIVLGLISGIRSLLGSVGSVLLDGIHSGIDGLKRGLGISSPSKVFAEIGRDTVAGYVQGVEQSAAAAQASTLDALGPSATRPGAAASPAQRFVIEVTGDDDGIAGAFREFIRTRFGGDVDAALGTA